MSYKDHVYPNSSGYGYAYLYEGANLMHRDLRTHELKGRRFRRCSFENADLRGVDLVGVAFDGCDFTGALRLDEDPPLAGWRLERGRLVCEGHRPSVYTLEMTRSIPPEPPHTCPMIDEVITTIEEVRDRLDEGGDEPEALYDAAKSALRCDLLDGGAEDELESIRKNAEALREWGQAWKELALRYEERN